MMYVCFVISLSICYWLFKCRVLRVVRVWERERDRVTVGSAILIAACVCEWERERETGSYHSGVYSPSEIVLIAACLQTHEWMMHLYSALLCIAIHPKRFTITWGGGHSSTTTSVQHPLGWCDGSHRTTAPVRSPHTSYRWRGER